MSDSRPSSAGPSSAAADGEASAQPARPDSITIATELWLVVILGWIVTFIGTYPSMSDSIRTQLRADDRFTPEQLELATSTPMMITMIGIVGLGLTAISGTMVWLTRKGYHWARIVLSAFGVYTVVNLIFALFGTVEPLWVMVPMVIGGVSALGATILLMRADSDTYCKDMSRYRRELKRPALPPMQYPAGPYPPYQYGAHQNPAHPHPGHPHPGHQSPYPQAGPYPGYAPPADPGHRPGDADESTDAAGEHNGEGPDRR